MNKKTMWWIVGVVIVVVIVIVVVQMGHGGPGSPLASPFGSSVKCTYTSQVSGASTQGTIYMAGNLLRMDIVATISAGYSITTHMIDRDQKSYSWNNMANQGTETSIPGPPVTPLMVTGQNVLIGGVNYSCAPWTVDQSMFTVPPNITFTEANTPVGGMQGGQ
jgi:hypothetical protein